MPSEFDPLFELTKFLPVEQRRAVLSLMAETVIEDFHKMLALSKTAVFSRGYTDGDCPSCILIAHGPESVELLKVIDAKLQEMAQRDSGAGYRMVTEEGVNILKGDQDDPSRQ
jgi:hypothetical protein